MTSDITTEKKKIKNQFSFISFSSGSLTGISRYIPLAATYLVCPPSSYRPEEEEEKNLFRLDVGVYTQIVNNFVVSGRGGYSVTNDFGDWPSVSLMLRSVGL